MTRLPVVRRLFAVGMCLATLACASSGAQGSSEREPRYEAPKMLSRVRPELSMSGIGPGAPGSRAAMRLSIEVEVDELGRADVSTMKLTGPGATENRTAIQQWLQASNFQPAKRGGVPVRGVFKMSIEGRVTVRRIG